jgi:hypothetical protein
MFKHQNLKHIRAFYWQNEAQHVNEDFLPLKVFVLHIASLIDLLVSQINAY